MLSEDHYHQLRLMVSVLEVKITSPSANGLRIAYGNYGFFIRNDGGSTYLMLTTSGDKFGTWNGLRPADYQ